MAPGCMKIRAGALALPAACAPSAALAHAADQGFVLLLPTDVYITAAILAFILTIVLIAFLPAKITARLGAHRRLSRYVWPRWISDVSSLLATLGVMALVAVGLYGPRDPLSNLLPLTIWSVWWIGFVSLHLIFGNIWRWIDPWAGVCRLIFGADWAGMLRLPAWLGIWPAILTLMLFTLFSIADSAPYDPSRLATFALGYWAFSFAGMAIFGHRSWSAQCECFSVFFAMLSALSMVRTGPGLSVGFPGWAIPTEGRFAASKAILCLVFLGAGSFDGLNETFWWLARIGVNPLDFQGRSTIVAETTGGFLGSIVLLIGAFWACVALGKWLAGPGGPGVMRLFRALAYSLVPIGLGFHIAHFFTSFVISIQYARLALTDPMATGANWLGYSDLRVYVGFLRDSDIVRVIWLSQAAVIVLSHVLAVMIAHRVTRELFPSRRGAQLAELQLSLFMVLYTLFGLWLLAAARGA